MKLINPAPLSEFNYAAKRPVYSVLGSEKGLLMPEINDALDRYFFERQVSDDSNDIVINSKAG